MARASKPPQTWEYAAWGGFIKDGLHLGTVARTRQDAWIETLHLLSGGDLEIFDAMTKDRESQRSAVQQLKKLGWRVGRILITEVEGGRGKASPGKGRLASREVGQGRPEGTGRPKKDRR